jgi:hypothetical protein
MARSLWALLVVAASVAAQEPEIAVRKLTIGPAAAPEPALRYKLLPEVRDTTPGNAALLYDRAFAPEWSSHVHSNKDLQKAIEEALDKSPAEVNATADLRFIRDWQLLKEVDRAARRDYCDWELVPRVREDGISLLLPDVQGMREFARYLKVRAKLELADRQFDRAAYTMQTGFQMGRHVGDAPTLIQALVGAAVTAVMLDEAEDWIKVPGSPNLYWALTSMPQPSVDLRKPFQGERLFMDNLFPGFREALAARHATPLSAEQLRELTKKLGQLDREGAPAWAIMAITAKKYGPAKQYLKSHDWSADDVEALPAMQVVLLVEVADYDRLFDEMIKWQGQPYYLSRPGLDEAERQLKSEIGRSGSPSLSIAGMLLPAVQRVHFAAARTDRNINLLRTVEALRLHLAAHGGLPATLADMTAVPVPVDPVTGKPFDYRVDGNTAVLTAPPPAGERPNAGNSRRYEITLAK